MARPGERGPTESGVMVYPKLPVPKAGRESDPRIKKGFDRKKLAMFGGTLLGGIVLGFLVRPVLTTDSRVGALETKVEEASKAASAEKDRADAKAKELDKIASTVKDTEGKLVDAQKAQTALANQAKEAQAKAKESEAAQAKLKAVVDKNVGVISADGDEIKLELVDKVMFLTLDDQLTPRGKQVLDRVASALKELPEKQIWVQGHTDDQPIAILPAPKAPPPKRGAKPGPPPAPPAPKFATNWELSAARALTVVHYLQDTAKIDPGRLAALAFGQYRPISRNRAANRRIEIVLYPKPVAVKLK